MARDVQRHRSLDTETFLQGGSSTDALRMLTPCSEVGNGTGPSRITAMRLADAEEATRGRNRAKCAIPWDFGLQTACAGSGACYGLPELRGAEAELVPEWRTALQLAEQFCSR